MNENQKLSVGRWWKKLEKDKVECLLCPRQCVLDNDQRGFCFIRKNNNGILKTNNGYISTIALDPVEKKPLYHFHPGTQALSIGAIGCNLACRFCQNWPISKPSSTTNLNQPLTADQLVFTAKELRSKSVAFTYNEPMICTEYIIELAAACQAQEIKTIAVSAGYINPKPREEFFKCMDAANIDLKSFSTHFYKNFCLSDLAPVLDTLLYIKQETSCWLEITNLIIPGENDSDSEIKSMCAWIARNLGAEVPIHFSAFHPDHQMTDHQPTPKSTLERARKIALDEGLRYPYTGNISTLEGSTTFCYTCQKALIRRQGYAIVKSDLDSQGRCQSCQTKIQGYF
jgi:pyruvate formate lyase activating enzyme